MRRRDALKALALLPLAAACGVGREDVRVVAAWSGWELTQFRRILEAFPYSGRWRLNLMSAGNDVGALLSNRAARTAAPEVALVQQVRTIQDNRDRLVPIGPTEGVAPGWERLLTFDGKVYGRWFKVTHKSMVWYRPDLMEAEPQSWDHWVQICRDMAASGRPPLAVGAADGWVLTDWFENVLLSMDPDTYRALAQGAVSWQHPSVQRSLERLGQIWSIPGVIAGGRERALLTQYDGALVDVFQRGLGVMVAGGDYCYPIVKNYGDRPADWFRFPHATLEQRPLVMGGDAVVLLEPGTEGGRRLVEWLSQPDAAEIWARKGGFLSLDARVADYPDAMSALANEVRQDPGQSVTFDLSDQLGGALTGGDGRGSWKIFQDFFARVAEQPSQVERAVRHTIDALDRASWIGRGATAEVP